ncbi:MAG: hypothetical protein WKF58_10700 [Ilumatobacteraceae bacterium]
MISLNGAPSSTRRRIIATVSATADPARRRSAAMITSRWNSCWFGQYR